MIDNPFRKVLPKFTGPLVSFYSSVGLTPNMISIASVFVALFATLLCAGGYAIPAIIVWWAGRLLDGTDGIYARATNQQSDFGAYLDIVCDMASYAMMILGFMILYPKHPAAWSFILFLYVLCIASALALGSLEAKNHRPLSDNRGLRLGAGLAEGGETGIAYTLFLLFPSAITPLVWSWVLILIATIVARSFLARRIL